MLLLLLLVGSRYAYAQNSPTNPFIDSWHKYHAANVDLANTESWVIQSDLTSSPAVSYNLTTLDNGGATWITIGNENIASVDYSYIEIKFIDANFDPNQTWYLVYSETNAAGSCTARRSFEIQLETNSFYLSVPVDNFDCNRFSEDVWNNVDGNISLPNREDSLQFTVTMNKDALFLVDKWRFNATFSIQSGSHNLSTPLFHKLSGSSGNGTYTISSVIGGDFSMEIILSPDNYGGESDAVSFWVYVTGKITTDYSIKLEITGTGGEADSGSAAYTVHTSDNLSGNRIEVRTIYGVPNTSTIIVSSL